MLQGHILSDLKEQDGFRIRESKPAASPDAPPSYCSTAEIMFGGNVLKDHKPSPKGLLPLREHIPYTEGRALPWKLIEHLQSARARKWPEIKLGEFNGQTAALCGGGPSLGDSLYDLRTLQKRGAKVMAINRTHDFLFNLPGTHHLPWVKPWAGILLETIPHAANYIAPKYGVKYFISSQCAPETFDKFERSERSIWHAMASKEFNESLTAQERYLSVPPVGSTCGLRAIMLLYMLGFTRIHLFGFDSCYRNYDVDNGLRGSDSAPRLHAYHKPEAIHDAKQLVVRDWADGIERTWWGNGNMLAQADEFHKFMLLRRVMFADGRMKPHLIVVHGDGVIPQIARELSLEPTFNVCHFDTLNERERKIAA